VGRKKKKRKKGTTRVYTVLHPIRDTGTVLTHSCVGYNIQQEWRWAKARKDLSIEVAQPKKAEGDEKALENGS